jgi:hypothetical protein
MKRGGQSDDGTSVGGNTRPEVSLETSRMSGGSSSWEWRRLTHSFATGPVIADPFISPFGLTMTPALSYKFALRESQRTHEVKAPNLKVEEHAVSPTPCLTLADNDGGHS